jgi:hypothetical protein
MAIYINAINGGCFMSEQINYLTNDQAQDLVERIQKRCLQFDYEMSQNEAQAMADLLSDIGVRTSDLIDISNLADNYAINAEIVKTAKRKTKDHSMSNAEDFLGESFISRGEQYLQLHNGTLGAGARTANFSRRYALDMLNKLIKDFEEVEDVDAI